jgi:hypothetical protein
MISFHRLHFKVEAVGVEPTGVGFVDPASNLAAPIISKFPARPLAVPGVKIKLKLLVYHWTASLPVPAGMRDWRSRFGAWLSASAAWVATPLYLTC